LARINTETLKLCSKPIDRTEHGTIETVIAVSEIPVNDHVVFR